MNQPDLLPWPNKTPAEIFAVAVDWTALAAARTIVGATVAVLSGDVTVDNPEPTTLDGLVQAVWLAGGTSGYASFICEATFTDGTVFTQRFYLFVR